MSHIKITCLCTKIDLPDLGLSLLRGGVSYVLHSEGANSQDLQRAIRAGAVSAERAQQYRDLRALRSSIRKVDFQDLRALRSSIRKVDFQKSAKPAGWSDPLPVPTVEKPLTREDLAGEIRQFVEAALLPHFEKLTQSVEGETPPPKPRKRKARGES